MLPLMTVDFETRSYLDVRNVGAWRYAEDKTTEILFLSYKRKDWDHAKLWIAKEEDFPKAILDHIEQNGVFSAFHAQFERALWIKKLKPLGIPVPKNWKDSQASCAYKGIPMALDKAGAALDLPIQKNQRGKYLIQKLCKPKWGTKNDPTRIYIEDPELMREFGDYCIEDSESEECLLDTVGELPAPEYKIWIMDQIINQRGVKIDVDAVNCAVKIVEAVEHKLTEQLIKITDEKMSNSQST